MSAAPVFTDRKRMPKKPEKKVPLYAKIPESLRQLFGQIAEAHGRKINAELVVAIRAHCEKYRGDVPPSEDASEEAE
jgi:hypothetical protein